MADPRAGASDPERRVGELVETFLRLEREGKAPDRERFLAEHPEVADRLRGSLEALDLFGSGSKGEDLRGRKLGRYEIVREIGRGGMGVVYEAHDIELDRRVALKVLPFAGMLDPKHLQRFQTEAQAAARLHHSNIVPVFGVGSDKGVNYYAMQFIDGQNLATVIKDLSSGHVGPPLDHGSTPLSEHGSAKAPRYVRTVVALAAKAAEALDYAHQVGVVHRDIKPGNLMVDRGGTLWVTDFGLAQIERNAGVTMTGDLVGTLRYMSPEQALAKRVPIDHRTDIYSLAVTIYELLTLEPAVKGDDPQTVLQEIAFKDPVPPRKLNPAIPPELETVLIKSLAKDPAARYATAQEMADDFRRVLEDKPVLARRPTLLDRTTKWARRNRTLVAAGFIVLMTAVVALAVSTLTIARAESDTHAALDRAEQSLTFGHKAVDEFLMQAGIKDLDRAPLPGPARKKLLEKALQFYETFLSDREDALAHFNRGVILDSLERYDEAVKAFDRAIELDPSDATVHIYRGNALDDADRSTEAFEAYDRAIEIDPKSALAYRNRGATLSRQDRNEDALVEFTRAAELDPDYANAHSSRGDILLRLGRNEEAVEAYDRALELNPNNARTQDSRGVALGNMNRFAEALKAHDCAIEIDPRMAGAHHNRAVALRVLGRHEEALQAINRAIELDPNVAIFHSRRGRILCDLKVYGEALRAYDRALEIDPLSYDAQLNRVQVIGTLRGPAQQLEACDHAAATHPEIAQTAGFLVARGTALWDLRRNEEALEAFDRAIEIDPEEETAHNRRGCVLNDGFRRYAEALKAFERAIELDPESAVYHDNRGNALRDLGKPVEALRNHDRAIQIDPDYGLAHYNRGVTLERLGRVAEALEECDRAIEIDPDDARFHRDRGDALSQLGRPEEALEAYERAVELGMAYPAFDRRVAELRAKVHDLRAARTRGAALYRAGRWLYAVSLFEKVLELGGGGNAHDWLYVAMLHAQLGHRKKAREWYEKSVAWIVRRKPDDKDLAALRREAWGVLGMQGSG